jgi:hypothetical protein
MEIDPPPLQKKSAKLKPPISSHAVFSSLFLPSCLPYLPVCLTYLPTCSLQLCTPIRKVIDPSIGVGAGINLCALLAGSRWIKPLVLGWATTKWVRKSE